MLVIDLISLQRYQGCYTGCRIPRSGLTMTLGFFFPHPSESRVEACLTAMLHFSRSLAITTISLSLHPRRWEESHECFCRRLCWSQQVLKVNKTFRGRNFLIKFLHHPLITSVFPLLHIFSLGLHPLDSFRSKIKWSQHFLWVIKLEQVIRLVS